VEGLVGAGRYERTRKRLDPDQLDERAAIAEMVGKDEIVLPYGPERRLQ
jgi:hypothetical protein